MENHSSEDMIDLPPGLSPDPKSVAKHSPNDFQTDLVSLDVQKEQVIPLAMDPFQQWIMFSNVAAAAQKYIV